MKRLNNLWPHITSFNNLLLAYQKAQKGKARKKTVAAFTLNLEHELISLEQQLKDGSYEPGNYRFFTLYERKPRIIAAAPFRDRVVHHAIMNLIEPPIDKKFIYDSYACRQWKGVHSAVDRYQKWSKRYRYVLKMDIQQYFPSIDHIILKKTVRHHIKDKKLLHLLDTIINSAVGSRKQIDLFAPRATGIPIGNLTSQFFANLYLNNFDHHIKEQLRIHPYLRYVDDFMILDDDKKRLHDIREHIREYLVTHHRLCLHPRKANIMPTRKGVDILGYMVFPHKRKLRNDNGHRFYRKLRSFAEAYAKGKINWADFNPSVQSWIGHAKHGNTIHLRHKIFSNTVFLRS